MLAVVLVGAVVAVVGFVDAVAFAAASLELHPAAVTTSASAIVPTRMPLSPLCMLGT